jgi:hypothetical protein
MSETDDTAAEVQSAQLALAAAQKKHDDAVRRQAPPKHVSEMTPNEIKAEERRRNLRNY